MSAAFEIRGEVYMLTFSVLRKERQKFRKQNGIWRYVYFWIYFPVENLQKLEIHQLDFSFRSKEAHIYEF